MSRSVKKGPFFCVNLLKKIEKARRENNFTTVIKTTSRATMILPELVGFVIGVHNGRDYISVLVDEDMISHKLGEFSPTRTYRGHAADRKTKK